MMEFKEFIDWNYLSTFAGLVSIVGLIVQFTKSYVDKLPFRVPTQIYSYLVSVLVMFLVEIFEAGGNGLTLSEAFLALFNGLIVSISANGGYEAIMKFLKN